MFPTLELEILKWEVKSFVEKDEDFNPIIGPDGQPVVTDKWVILTVALGGKEFPIELECPEFFAVVLPKILDPAIRFWRSVPTGHPLFPKREATLEWLLSQKAARPELCDDEE